MPDNEVTAETKAAAVAAIAQAGVMPHVVEDWEDIATVVVPQDARLEVIDLEQKLPVPRRKKGEVRLYDAASLATYVNRHKGEGTQLYSSDRSYQVIAVLNDHDPIYAGWRDHNATLALRKTDEWERWRAKDGKQMTQEEFAEHIEESVLEVQVPSGAELLELAQTFQATTKAEFQSAKRLSDGQQQVSYVEEVTTKGGGRGDLTIPKEFVLGIAPFDGCDPYKVTARLRIRLRGGDLKISYLLNRPADIERAAFRDVVTAVVNETGITALYGSPEL